CPEDGGGTTVPEGLGRLLMGQRGFLRLAFALWALNALLPVVAMLYTSVTPSGQLGFGAYTRMFTSPEAWDLLRTTFGLALATALAEASAVFRPRTLLRGVMLGASAFSSTWSLSRFLPRPGP